MKILFLSTWFPYPPDQGSKIRAYYLLRALARKHAVALVSYEDVDLQPAWREHINALCERVYTLPRKPFAAGRLKTLLGLFSPLPSAVVGMRSPDMAALVQTAAQDWQPDVVVALTFVTAPYALQLSGVRRVLDIDNYMARMLADAAEMPGSPMARLRRRLAQRKFLRYERKLYPQFDLCLAVTAADRAQVIAELGLHPERVTVTPNGVDTVYNHPGLVAPQAETLVYNGALTYQANYDAVEYFLNEIFPQVRQRFPGARLRVTGRTDGVDLDRLPLDNGVELTGYVDDVRQVVAGSVAAVAPLRVGGGTRLKILEAMALGVPVVSTPKGAEGLDVQSGRHLLIGRTAAEFAGEVIRLLEDPGLRDSISEQAREYVCVRYDWEKIGDDFCHSVECLLDGPFSG